MGDKSSNVFQETLANSNLTFKRIRFDRNFCYKKNDNEYSNNNNNYKSDTYVIECSGNNPVFLMLEPETNDEFECISGLNIKITLELIKKYDNNSDKSEVKDSSNYNSLNDDIYNDELEDDYEIINNSVTSTVVSTPKNLLMEEMCESNPKSKNEIKCGNELEYYCSYDKKRSIKRRESIKRQLTSNPYVDICRNPEWPFTRKKNKLISRNDKSNLFADSNNNGNKGELKASNTVESNSVKNKSSRGRSRQWLESLATLFDGIYTQRSTLGRSAGLGLFSDRHFEKNEIITEFVGWVIDRNEALRLRSEGKATHICDLIKPSLYLDGEKDPKPFIGGGSFANDGSTFLGGPGNNSKFWKWYDEREGRTRVFLKATQEIKPNEEIFVGYCKDYWVDFAEKDIVKHKTNVSNESGISDIGRRKKNNSSLNTESSDLKLKSKCVSKSEYDESSCKNKNISTNVTDQKHNINNNIDDSRQISDLNDSNIEFRSKSNENKSHFGSIFD
ncbi:SET domain containing protein [Cryptosporidium ryanae]|uniref:SET domain containing protein n=1 Tax=Cryptosporidium ryanae TaxID=515981 RepID=UPI00351A42C1|nr:SET domain containing protein [Cryptosporidium ryanae]